MYLYQKHTSIGVLRKSKDVRDLLGKKYSENMQQIYSRIPMLKCDFNKVAKQCKATLLKSHFGMDILL